MKKRFVAILPIAACIMTLNAQAQQQVTQAKFKGQTVPNAQNVTVTTATPATAPVRVATKSEQVHVQQAATQQVATHGTIQVKENTGANKNFKVQATNLKADQTIQVKPVNGTVQQVQVQQK